jgi:hypothetical protein
VKAPVVKLAEPRFLTCGLFTTSVTLGLPVVTFSARAFVFRVHLSCERDYTVLDIMFHARASCWISVASRFPSMPLSRSKFTALASLSARARESLELISSDLGARRRLCKPLRLLAADEGLKKKRKPLHYGTKLN